MTHPSGSGGSSPEPRFLTVGRVLRAWGIRGDLKIQPFTDRPEDFTRFDRVYVGPAAAARPQRFAVQSFRPYRGNWLLHLAGVDSRSEAERLHGQSLFIERAQWTIEPGEYLVDQIIGLSVQTVNGEALGTITEIIKTGANDVYVVTGPREILLPARPEVVRQIDLARGVMIVSLLPGL
jgi:16S rRNA processing protein RimM